ncbi:HHHH-motif protein [Variovorax sp. H27-G14]|uniref:HHHH-motif protein n=1 Tax=Variovorax sp. H27-G14 TaxID=3111914 RepID=UPI0038FC2265
MKTKQLILSSILAFAGLAVLAPSIASAAPNHRAHKVCKWDARHHHRVCHWVR